METYFISGVSIETGAAFAMVAPHGPGKPLPHLGGCIYTYTRAARVSARLDKLRTYDSAVAMTMTEDQALRCYAQLWSVWHAIDADAATAYRLRIEDMQCSSCAHNAPHGSVSTECVSCVHLSMYRPA